MNDSKTMTFCLTQLKNGATRPGMGAQRWGLRGFTLLEVMITAVIVAVLAAIALPSYRDSVIRGNRSAAKQFASDVANHEEQYLLDQRSYTSTYGSGGLGMTPPTQASMNYTFSIATAGNNCLGNALPSSAPAYVITGTAIGAQASDGNLCLDNLGNRTPAAKWSR
ncbi:MAG TPA: type IV pilin protein [Gemmatimonadaceae bacterium]|nr:type IV pilin protein [Gemmatimonadaceae bacterium]